MPGFLSVGAIKSNQYVCLTLRTLFKIVKIGCVSRKFLRSGALQGSALG